jgi:hypothetical protein
LITGIAALSVSDDEMLARFILFRDHIRSDDTVRPDAFIPYRYIELSVTRHLGLSDSEIHGLGKEVAAEREKEYHGRADLKAAVARANRLNVVSSEPPRNHANIIGWPAEKSEQKLIALVLAEKARFVVADQ